MTTFCQNRLTVSGPGAELQSFSERVGLSSGLQEVRNGEVLWARSEARAPYGVHSLPTEPA
jgi:hypothetical protein